MLLPLRFCLCWYALLLMLLTPLVLLLLHSPLLMLMLFYKASRCLQPAVLSLPLNLVCKYGATPAAHLDNVPGSRQSHSCAFHRRRVGERLFGEPTETSFKKLPRKPLSAFVATTKSGHRPQRNRQPQKELPEGKKAFF